jgi:hypothetical protein
MASQSGLRAPKCTYTQCPDRIEKREMHNHRMNRKRSKVDMRHSKTLRHERQHRATHLSDVSSKEAIALVGQIACAVHLRHRAVRRRGGHEEVALVLQRLCAVLKGQDRERAKRHNTENVTNNRSSADLLEADACVNVLLRAAYHAHKAQPQRIQPAGQGVQTIGALVKSEPWYTQHPALNRI